MLFLNHKFLPSQSVFFSQILKFYIFMKNYLCHFRNVVLYLLSFLFIYLGLSEVHYETLMIYFGKNLYNNQVRCFDYFRKISCFLVLYTLQHHDCFQDFSIISCQDCFLLLRQINSEVLVIFHSSSIGRANYQTRHK